MLGYMTPHPDGIAKFKCPYSKADIDPHEACEDQSFYCSLINNKLHWQLFFRRSWAIPFINLLIICDSFCKISYSSSSLMWIQTTLKICDYKLNFNWRASETLTGVTQLKIGDVCLFVYMFGRTYVILYFDPRIFVLVMWSTPSQITLNRVLWFIDQYPYHPRNWIVYCFEFFCGCS